MQIHQAKWTDDDLHITHPSSESRPMTVLSLTMYSQIISSGWHTVLVPSSTIKLSFIRHHRINHSEVWKPQNYCQ
uniref:Uncharacterized protein n=1 Tax=Arundo donax TaxID=35708 RepID=A0A0A9F8H0_ARUDO